jgi:hypothetical protein
MSLSSPIIHRPRCWIQWSDGLFLLSVASLIFFVLGVAGFGSKTVSTEIPFSVSMPGNYSLYIGLSQKTAADSLELQNSVGNEIINRHRISSIGEMEVNGAHYVPVGYFHISSPGTYSVIDLDKQSIEGMIFTPTYLFLWLILAFILAALSFVSGLFLRFNSADFDGRPSYIRRMAP